ncbi:hypothetical protein K402DRAFT_101759 [Aulographum hederae CBS 113979]|uniref:Uncharacterized protein n=1 Tax=Aulographum hederae CBS 113979 TaxID=1176131 RepID=A0A6G1GXZ8_9PEZI|nr:hypothetical protein K402DRAFT_101759 [Aulographum hederae CBS 113979]
MQKNMLHYTTTLAALVATAVAGPLRSPGMYITHAEGDLAFHPPNATYHFEANATGHLPWHGNPHWRRPWEERDIVRVDSKNIGAYMCREANWKGTCRSYKNLVADRCYAFNGDDDNSATSWGPDKGVECIIYKYPKCITEDPSLSGVDLMNVVKFGGGFFKDTTYPGFSNLAKAKKGGQWWDNSISSFRCHRQPGWVPGN